MVPISRTGGGAARPPLRLSNRGRVLLLAAAGLLLFLPFLGRRDIVTSHEARVAQTAREMAAAGWPWASAVEVPPVAVRMTPQGARSVPQYDAPPLRVNPWLVPVMNGEMRLQKPPLPYWCAAVLFKLFGFGEAWARLVPALMGALAALVMFDLARALLGRRAGWVAAVVWLSSYFVFDEYRKAMADPYLAFFTLTAVWAWVRAAGRGGNEDRGWKMEDGEKRRSRRAIFHPLSSILVFYLSLALGLLSKGPLILPPVGLGILAFHRCYRRPVPRGWAVHAAGVGLLLAVTLPWPLYVMNHVPRAAEVWRYESTRGLTDAVDNEKPWWFYLPALFQIALPWTPVFAAGLVFPLLRSARKRLTRPVALDAPEFPDAGGVVGYERRTVVEESPAEAARRRRALWRASFPVLWLLAVLVAFSLSGQKKNAYLLPIMPAVVLTTARPLGAVLAYGRLRRLQGWPGAILSVQTGIAFCFAVALPVLIWRSGAAQAAGFALAGLVLAAAILTVRLTQRPRRWLAAAAAAYGLAHLVFFNFAVTAGENARSAKPFARAVAGVVAGPGASVVTSYLPPEASLYLPLGVKYRPGAGEVLLVVDDRTKASEKGLAYFAERVPAGRVVSAKRVTGGGVPDSGRWKLYRLRVESVDGAARGE